MTKRPNITHTLQTWQGMVRDGGKPIRRDPPFIFVDLEFFDNTSPSHPLEDLARHIREGSVPAKGDWWLRNCVIGMTQPIDMADLKKIIFCGQRLDMEEAAALVMSMLGRETAAKLVPHLSLMVKNRACMWTATNVKEAYDDMLPQGSSPRAHYVLSKKMNDWELLCHVLGGGRSPPAFLQALRFVRRSGKNAVGLDIPEWVFIYAGEEYTEECAKGEPIAVSKKAFRVLQRWLKRALGRNDPASFFRRQVTAVTAEMYGRVGVSPDGRICSDHIRVLMNTEDPLALAYSFIVLQRQRQLKVVSDMNWTKFLAKGETCHQNDHQTASSFEMALVELVLQRGDPDWKAFCAVRCPPDIPEEWIESDKRAKMADLVDRMKRICLLMKEYVTIYGDGDWNNLILRREHRVNRGPVDQYNNLCSALYPVSRQYSNYAKRSVEDLQKDGIIPGSMRKFLACDIMAWHNSWGDDAFADFQEPAWSLWLKRIGVTD